jgi:hypothetical protein
MEENLTMDEELTMNEKLTADENRHGFDFMTGAWEVQHRRLVAFEPGAEQWQEFVSRAEARMVLGGTANLDEVELPNQGFHGLTLRLYDPARDQWSLNWVSSRNGVLDPPVVGRFTEPGRGEFYGTDVHEDRQILVRYRWSRTDTPTPRWEQAFRWAENADWEINWIMDFRRL